MKRKIPYGGILAAALPLIVPSSLAALILTLPAACGGDPLPHPDDSAVYAWFEAGQLDNGLLRSNETFELCFLYDQALAAILYTSSGDYERADNLLDFFAAEMAGQESQAGFAGFADAYRDNGAWGDPSRSCGPMAWLLLAVNRYTVASGDTSYLSMGRRIADFLLAGQAREGGVIGGYDRWGRPMAWVSTEHNLDAYSALRDYYRITGDTDCAAAAWRIRNWLLWDPWVPEERRFTIGRNDPNYATDVSSWAVASLGPSFGPTLRYAEEVALCRHNYRYLGAEVEGFDFGAPYSSGTLPDRDAVWFEGTAQMALAYRIAGEDDKADYFLAELARCLTPSPNHPGTYGLPYASNPGTPPYGTWVMPDSPPCVSSGAWYLFARRNVNPFTMDDDLEGAERVLADLAEEEGWGSLPRLLPAIDDFEASSEIVLLASYPERLRNAESASASLIPDETRRFEGEHSGRIEFHPEAAGGSVFFERTFGRPEDASEYTGISGYIHGDGAGHLISFIVRDGSGSLYRTPPFSVDFNGWTLLSVPLEALFPLIGDEGPDLSSITGAGFMIEAGSLRDSVINLDDIRFIRG